jgi:PKHD-type hydroxylase
MMLAISGILSRHEAEALRDAAGQVSFGDGRSTAGVRAREVKANEQAVPSPGRDAILEKARAAIPSHPVFGAAARPRQLTPLILSRYRVGQTYGLHVDDALMGGLRTDLSFTLFLSDPETYDGGGLAIEDHLGTREVRLEAGALVLYPSTTLHRVTPVTRGERLAIVGWVESWVRGAAEREVLFDLDQIAASLPEGSGRELGDLVAKVRSNLTRLWAGA